MVDIDVTFPWNVLPSYAERLIFTVSPTSISEISSCATDTEVVTASEFIYVAMSVSVLNVSPSSYPTDVTVPEHSAFITPVPAYFSKVFNAFCASFNVSCASFTSSSIPSIATL